MAFLHRVPFALDALDIGFLPGFREDCTYQQSQFDTLECLIGMLDNDFRNPDLDRYVDRVLEYEPDVGIIGGCDVLRDVADALLGTLIAQTCRKQGIPVMFVEHDPEQHQLVKEDYDQYVLGDAMSETTWRRANVETARLMISTVSQRRLSDRILALDTDADTILRSANTNGAVSLLNRGVDYVIVPDYLASERLLEKIREALSEGVSSAEFRRQNEGVFPSETEFRT